MGNQLATCLREIDELRRDRDKLAMESNAIAQQLTILRYSSRAGEIKNRKPHYYSSCYRPGREMHGSISNSNPNVHL